MAILTTLYLDPFTNDWVIENGVFKLTATKAEYAGAAVKARCETVRGEWYRDYTKGLPYYEEILVGDPDFDNIENIFTGEAREVEYVLDIVGYEYDFDNATGTYSARITLLVEGETAGDGPATITVEV